MSFWDMLPVVLLTLFVVTLCTGGIYANRYLEKERTRLLDLAKEIFGNEVKLARWLNERLKRFEGRSPIEMMESRDGLKEVERYLIALQEGYF